MVIDFRKWGKNAILILPLILFSVIKGNCQVDSIEYNIGESIFDFKIQDQQYFFRNWSDKSIVENDSIIFETNVYFNNYSDNHLHYIDSAELAVTSRTLKIFYKELILFDKGYSFIRICWLKGKNPTIFNITQQGEELITTVKVGNGFANLHGKIIIDTPFQCSKKDSKYLKKIMKDDDLYSIDNMNYCPKSEWHLLSNFYFEVSDGKKYNVFVVNECNLESEPYKRLLQLYKKLEKKSLPRFPGRGAGVSKRYKILERNQQGG
jgi:hypothetical protein